MGADSDQRIPGAQIAPGTWVFNDGVRGFIFSDVPAGITVYKYPLSLPEVTLKGKPKKNDIAEIVSIFGDFRFIDNETYQPVTAFSEKLTLQVSITDEEATIFQTKKFKKKWLVQIINPDQENAIWDHLTTHSLKILSDAVYGSYHALITFSAWGADPPSGWGVGQ